MNRLKYLVNEWLHTIYYRWLFGRRFPLAARLDEWVCAWGRRRAGGDVPQAKEIWDREYEGGKWDFIGGEDENPRFEHVVTLLKRSKPGAAILDVGCGPGFFYRKCRGLEYAKYVGVEISAAALATFSNLADERSEFHCSDAETFQPEGFFDVIIFSECLCYFRDPIGSVTRYAKSLKPGGYIIVSSFTDMKRAVAIVRRLKRDYCLKEEANVTSGHKTWLVTIFVLPTS